MVLRFLLFLASGFLLFLFFKIFSSWLKRKRLGRPMEAQEMVLDPQCQSYLPKADAIARSGHYFCSEECARLYLAS